MSSPSYSTWIRKGISVFFEYDTPKIVHIESKTVGVTSRFVQACILSYIIGYVIVYQKGYQQFDDVQWAVTSKLKGVTYTNFSDAELVGVPVPAWKSYYRRIWDVTDYVVPPTQTNAFFVTTNVVITPNQTHGACPEDPDVPGAQCRPDGDGNDSAACPRGASSPLGHGVNTGKCVPSSYFHHSGASGSSYSCEVLAWCPIEQDEPPLGPHRALLEASKDFTVLIKNQIEFPLYGRRRTNILESSNQTYLTACLYDEASDPFCPKFKLEKMVQLAGESYGRIASSGGVLSVGIHWDCDLDLDFLTHCRPVYKFQRLDNPEAKIAPGWNFRHADYYGGGEAGGRQGRTLYKAYGILFVVDVYGRAGKFSFIPFFLNLGAGLALLGLATVICDVLVLYCMKDREVYREKKYLLVQGRDAFHVYREVGRDEAENYLGSIAGDNAGEDGGAGDS